MDDKQKERAAELIKQADSIIAMPIPCNYTHAELQQCRTNLLIAGFIKLVVTEGLDV